MPIPWLIGAAVVAAATAIVKAVSDDDSSSSGDEERRAQERQAERARKRDRLGTQLINLKENQVDHAKALLESSAKALGKRLEESTKTLKVHNFESAINSKSTSSSEYAQEMITALKSGNGTEVSTYSDNVGQFPLNLRTIDEILSPVTLSKLERSDIKEISAAAENIERLQKLKNKFER